MPLQSVEIVLKLHSDLTKLATWIKFCGLRKDPDAKVFSKSMRNLLLIEQIGRCRYN